MLKAAKVFFITIKPFLFFEFALEKIRGRITNRDGNSHDWPDDAMHTSRLEMELREETICRFQGEARDKFA